MIPTIDHGAPIFSRTIPSPLGALTLFADAHALVGVYFEAHHPAPRTKPNREGASAVLEAAEADFAAYFEDCTHRFRVPLAAPGTELERAVWAELARIPLGKTTTYGAVARVIGRPTAARAVGSAVGRNPLSIVVPCHRVVAANGSLTGFAGGVERKSWLLTHEGVKTRYRPG